MSSSYRDEEKNKVEKSTLYIVATPIGNLADITDRALKVLSEVDFVAAEDTRNTAKLLNLFGINKPLVCYFEHNKKKMGGVVIDRISKGESCALVTDAGTPAISDPGADLVKECIDAGIKVSSVPGASAVITALTLSGMDTRRFVFEGFLSAQKSERRKHLEELKGEKRTTVIYEAPHKLKTTLSDMLSILGNRKIALCRELTKLNEEVIRTDLEGACDYYSEREPRGEYVLVLEGGSGDSQESFWSNMTVTEHISHYEAQGLSKMDAIKATAKDRGVPKNTIYKETIK